MPRSPEETYIQTYQKYLKQKGTSEAPSTYTASTKLPKSDPSQCKICTVLAKPPDLYRVLNQGLYHKYTASQDYFYTRDINSLLNRKRKPFCVRYNDDLIYDECKERLKGFFRKKDSQSLMTEIKDFYTKFKNFPRNFHPHYSAIINSNIRKHRRLEYIKVFNNPNFDESRGPGDLEAPDDGQFNFMELLGSSFLQDNYKDISGVAVGGPTRDGESTMREITANFRALYSVPVNSVNEPGIEPFSNAMYNKNYMLYSRSDSTTAEDILKQIVNEFHEGNLEKKPVMTLAEKVLQQVAANNKNHPRKQENRYSSALKQRGQTGLESSSILHNSKKSLGSSTSIMTSSQLQVQKQNSQPLNTTSQRGNSNPRSNSHAETESTMLGKLSHNPSGKFSVENLNEIVINRNKILSKLYQFRSTRSKSGGLKSSGSTTTTSCKTPSAMGRRPLGIDTQGFDSVDSKQVQTMVYTQEKSHSQSPERRLSREKSAGAIEVNIPKQKMNAEAPYYSAGLPRSTSNGRNIGMMDARDLTSPLQPARTRSSPQKKTSGTSSVARRTPVVQNYIFDGVDNSGDSGLHNINNVSHNQENPNTNQQPTSPNNGKFINPLRNSLGGTQQNYYLRHQSPIDDRVTQVSSVLQKVRSEARMKNLNIRAMKNNSPNRVGTSPSRVGAMSFSRRQQTQTMLDVSQGANSFAAGQTANNGSHIAKNRSLRKSEAQVGGNKTSKRSSIIQNPVINLPEERVEKEKKTKKGALEISNGNVGGYKDLRLPSKEQTPSNFFPNSATSYQKIKNEMRRSGIGSFTTKANGKDVKFGVRK